MAVVDTPGVISCENVALAGCRGIAGDAVSGSCTTALRWVKNYDLRGGGSGCGVRTASQRVRLQMSEPQGYQQIYGLLVRFGLTFAIRTRGTIDANVKSA